jgi:hypothetical protein
VDEHLRMVSPILFHVYIRDNSQNIRKNNKIFNLYSWICGIVVA